MRNVFAVSAAVGVFALAGCQPSPSYEVAMCSEPIRISDCKVEDRLYPTCTIENQAQVPLRGDLVTWAYDRSGVRLGGNYPVNLIGLMPGQKKRAQLPADGGIGNIAKIVVCSMDPESPLMRNRITLIGQTK